MSYAKDNLAKLIQKGATFSELSQATRNVKKYPKFEVRRSKLSEGAEINIQNSGWTDAMEWSQGHINHLISDFCETSRRLNFLGVGWEQLRTESFFLTEDEARARIEGLSEFLEYQGLADADDAEYIENYILELLTTLL